jgi:hypothetical protein
MATYYAANRERFRKSHLARKFGLSLQQYDIMLLSQGGRCAICKEECATGNWLAVDHDHVSGERRGLLCQSCNTGLGKMRDNPAILRAAAEYIEFHSNLLVRPETVTQ